MPSRDADRISRWLIVLSLLAVVVSLAAFAASRAIWWALALDASAVFYAAVRIARGFE